MPEKIVNDSSSKCTDDQSIKKLRLRFPAQLYIDITNACNMRCNFCLMGEIDDKKYIDVEIIKKVLVECNNYKLLGITITGGEPLLHPKFNEIIDTISEYKIPIAVVTNGALLNSIDTDILEKITSFGISLRGNEEIDNCITSTKSYRRIVNNIVSLRTMFPDKKISINYTFTNNNDEYEVIDEICSFCKFNNLDLFFARVINRGYAKQNNIYTNLDKMFAAIEYFENKYGIQIAISNCIPSCVIENSNRRLVHGCSALLASIAINEEGKVKICSTDNKIIGDLQNNTLYEIWNGKNMEHLLNKRLPYRCLNCSKVVACRGGCKLEVNNDSALMMNDSLVANQIKTNINEIKNYKIVPKYKYVRDYGDKIELIMCPVKNYSGDFLHVIRELKNSATYNDLVSRCKCILPINEIDLILDALLYEGVITLQ